MLLCLVDIWKPIHQLKPAQITELGDEAQGFISPPHIELIEPQSIINTFEIMIVVLPPLIKISVGKFKNRRGKSIPSLVEVDEQIEFVLLELKRSDLHSIEQ